MSPVEIAGESNRKFRAKRANEHVKAFYSLINTLSAAIIITAFIAPTITKSYVALDLDARGWVAIGVGVHLFGQWVIWRYMKPEE